MNEEGFRRDEAGLSSDGQEQSATVTNDGANGTMPRPDPQAAQKFAEWLGGDVLICLKPPDSGPLIALAGPDALPRALQRNGAGQNVYFVANAVKPGVVKKPAKSDIEAIRMIYADIDWDRNEFAGRFREGLQALWHSALRPLLQMAPPPTLIILTGGGVQPLWRIEPMPPTPENMRRAEAASRHVGRRFGGDTVHNVDRVLRLPGSVNFPKEDKRAAGQPVRRADVLKGSGEIYRLEQLETAWGVEPSVVEPPVATPRPSAESAASVNQDLAGGMGELDALQDLATCREIGLNVASRKGGPFASRQPWVNPVTGEKTEYSWLDWLTIISGVADDCPGLEGECKRLYDEVNARAGGDQSQNEQQWAAQIGRKTRRVAAGETITGVGTLMKIMESVGPLLPVGATDSEWNRVDVGRCALDLALPHRQWALGVTLIYGEISVLAAPSGRKKTALAIALAGELAAGRDLIGNHVFQGRQKVLCISKEDSEDELKRRIQALARQHQLTQADVDNIGLVGFDARAPAVSFTAGKENAPTLDKRGFEALAKLIESHSPRVVILDPLTVFITVGLNNNTLMAQVMLELKRIAKARNVAILIVHHTRKDADLQSVDDIGGAGAIVNHARNASLLVEMTEAEMKTYPGVAPSERHLYSRLINGKASYAPPGDSTAWFKVESVGLNNPEPPCYPNEDSAPVVTVADRTRMCRAAPVHPTLLRTALGLVDKADKAGRPLTSSKRGGSARSLHANLETELRRSGHADPNLRITTERIVEAAALAGLIVEDEVWISKNKRKGLRLTPEGEAALRRAS